MIIAILGTLVSLFFLLFFMMRVGTQFGGFMIFILTMVLQITFLCLDNHFIESRREAEEVRS